MTRVRRSAEIATFAVLGDPVAHSASPAMHGAAFRALGIPAVYVALRPTAAGVGEVMRALVRTGGGGNVTVPFKAEAAAAAEVRSMRVERLGVANTFWADDGVLHADNTDVAGVGEAITSLGAPSDGPWLVIGTGGSARAVAAAACELGASLSVRSRDPARAAAFEAWAASIGCVIAPPGSRCAIVINATPLGLAASDALPIDASEARGAEAALDLVYTRGGTRWMHAMRAAGLRAADGRTMLLAQGVAAFRCWFPRRDAPVEIMRAALSEVLGPWS